METAARDKAVRPEKRRACPLPFVLPRRGRLFLWKKHVEDGGNGTGKTPETFLRPRLRPPQTFHARFRHHAGRFAHAVRARRRPGTEGLTPAGADRRRKNEGKTAAAGDGVARPHTAGINVIRLPAGVPRAGSGGCPSACGPPCTGRRPRYSPCSALSAVLSAER